MALSLRRIGMLAGCVALTGIMGGCFSSKKVAFTNVSDSWLNVRFYVANPEMEAMNQEPSEAPSDSPQFLAEGKLQVQPGETANYILTRNPNYSGQGEKIVHIQVEPVTPSWQPAGRSYWLELLTPPPVTIVATGSPNQLVFNSGTGAVAQIPEREIEQGRFDHRMVTVPESPQPQQH